MLKNIEIEMTCTAAGKPLAVVQNFPGLYAEMTPEELRKMAEWLVDAAEECEERPAFRKKTGAYTISYRVGE